MPTTYYTEPLSAMAAAQTLEVGGRDEKWLVIDYGGSWQYVYAACKSHPQLMEYLCNLFYMDPNRTCFTRHRTHRSDFWSLAQIADWRSKYPCHMCGLTVGDHP